MADRAVARAVGFAPIAAPDARVLLLGSLPGRESLAQRKYYAHPRNAFWRIMGELCGAGPEQPYAERTRRLRQAGIALWDVLAAAERPGSLDGAIIRHSEQPNNFARFLRRHPCIRLIAFNGGAAAAQFRRHALAGLSAQHCALPRATLPSTSPAHAALAYADKLARWRKALEFTGASPIIR